MYKYIFLYYIFVNATIFFPVGESYTACKPQWIAKVLQYLALFCCIVSLSLCLSESVSMLKWQGLRVLDSSWPQRETSHLHANLNHCILFSCSLTICRWNISNSCQSKGVAERLLCYMCTFACITESGFTFLHRMIYCRPVQSFI